MLIKKFTVPNPFNEDETTEVTTYWNLTRSELSDLLASDDNVINVLYQAIGSGDGPRIYKGIMRLMDEAYGLPAPDGLGLLKTPEVREAYRTGPVRDALIDWVVNDPDKASASIVNVLPKDFRDEALKRMNDGTK